MYDAHYYAHDCGEVYERNEKWLNFFGAIAERIVSDIAPHTVLDAGCAMGFLVECLRERGVEAFGVDISDYAIQNVYPTIKPYCRVGSIAHSLPQKYDLIVSIEVLEHIPREEAEQAIINLCQYTDDILFSSTPFDYKEVTHLNVHAPEYWAEQFARQGFIRDVDFDASFITPWAVRFRRSSEPLPRIIQEYERRFWLLWKENVDLRELSANMVNQLKHCEQTREAERAGYEMKLGEIQRVLGETQRVLGETQRVLEELETSMGWGLLKRLQRLRCTLFPPGSKRDQWLEISFQTMRAQGFIKGIATAGRTLPRLLDKNHILDSSSADDYQTWLKVNEPTSEELEQQRTQSQSFAYQPCISIIVPVYNPESRALQAALDSVLAQTYTHWELCLVDGNSDLPGVAEVLQSITERDDPRIRLTTLEQNQGISGNSNVALEMAQGEFVAFLDHDDCLAPNALFEIVNLLNQKPSLDLIYSDHDILPPDSNLGFQPLFKPDWSPEIMLSANYLTHLTVIRAERVREVGGFDSAMDGAQDWDLFLRITEKTHQIAHIPKILYHWRNAVGSTALDIGAKPYALQAQLRAITNHLTRQKLCNARAYLDASGFIRVAWDYDKTRKVSIIIPSNGANSLLTACVDSLLRTTTYPNYEIIIVNNGEQRPEAFDYYRHITKERCVRVVHFEASEFNYSAVNNFGAQSATGDLLLFLNNDIEIFDAEWLDELVLWTERPGIGVIGAKLLKPDHTIQHAGIIIGLTGFAGHIFAGLPEGSTGLYGFTEWYRNFMAVTGACLMVRRDLFEEVGRFNEDFQLCGSDVEFCLRVLERGLRVVYNPFAKLFHIESATHQGDIPLQDFKTSLDHYAPLLQTGDPYFNPNLSLWHCRPTLNSPAEPAPFDFARDFLIKRELDYKEN